MNWVHSHSHLPVLLFVVKPRLVWPPVEWWEVNWEPSLGGWLRRHVSWIQQRELCSVGPVTPSIWKEGTEHPAIPEVSKSWTPTVPNSFHMSLIAQPEITYCQGNCLFPTGWVPSLNCAEKKEGDIQSSGVQPLQ